MTTKRHFLPRPTRARAQIGDNYAHARTAETRPFLLLCLYGPGYEASVHCTRLVYTVHAKLVTFVVRTAPYYSRRQKNVSVSYS